MGNLLNSQDHFLYIGSRQQDTVSKNHDKFKVVKEAKPDANVQDVFSSDEFQVDISKIIEYKRKEKIELYDFKLSRDSFKLNRRRYEKV